MGTGRALFAMWVKGAWVIPRFDGHNGSFCAEWCKEHLVEIFTRLFQEGHDGEWPPIFEFTCRALLVAVIPAMGQALSSHFAFVDSSAISGCTCTLCYLHDTDLFAANLGDTQCVCGCGVIVRAFLFGASGRRELTVVHSAVHDQDRIREAGGWITSSAGSGRG